MRKNEPPRDKANKMAVRPVKTQISLCIRPVWSESSLSTWRKLKILSYPLSAQWRLWSDWADAHADLSLGIRWVWSASSLSARRNLGSLATHWAHSEVSDQIGRMLMLSWVLAVLTVILLVLSWGGSNGDWLIMPQTVLSEIIFCAMILRLHEITNNEIIHFFIPINEPSHEIMALFVLRKLIL